MLARWFLRHGSESSSSLKSRRLLRKTRARRPLASTVVCLLALQAAIAGGFLVATAAPAGATEAPPSFVLAWHDWDCESCGPFSGYSQFGNPTGVAVDAFGNVYVTDTANNRVDIFDGSGFLTWAWGSEGSGAGQFEGPTGVALDGFGNVFVIDTGNNRIERFDLDGDLVSTWGSVGTGNGQFQAPTGVTVDGSGNVFVANTGNDRVQKFDSSGNFLQAWGYEGGGDGGFEAPAGIATSPTTAGIVYVADTGNHRIEKFDESGNFLDAWGSEGLGQGEFEAPAGIAVESSGNVFVADTGNHRIQKFDSSGTFLSEWGSEGSDDGQFESPAGVSTDSSGDVFVADANNTRIQKFGPSSLELTVSTGAGSGTVTTSPSGIDCGTVCSASFANGGLVELFATPAVGSAFANWGGDCGGSGRCVIPMTQVRSVTARFEPGTALTVTMDGPGAGSITSTPLGMDCGATCSASFVSGSTVTLHASPNSESTFIGWSGDCSGTDDCVLTMGAARSVTATFGQSPPAFLLAFGSYGSGEGQFSGPSGVAVDGSGHVFVVAGNNRVAKFDDNGQYVLTIGGYGTGNDQFASPWGVAVDGSGNVFVADPGWPQIAKFDNDGNFLLQWSVTEMNGIAVDGSGNVFVTNNAGVAEFDNDGNFLMAWGSPGSGDGQFETATGIAIDAAGDVFVIDLGNDRIEKFDNDGNFLLAWGSLGTGFGRLNGPTGLAVDGSGHVYITENGFRATLNPFSRIQEFGSTGQFLSAWGSFGSGDGQFRYPSGVTVDSAGSVFVVDQGNARIEKFGHPTFDLTSIQGWLRLRHRRDLRGIRHQLRHDVFRSLRLGKHGHLDRDPRWWLGLRRVELGLHDRQRRLPRHNGPGEDGHRHIRGGPFDHRHHERCGFGLDRSGREWTF